LLAYFGETLGSANCGSCDNCLEPRPLRDATIEAQKMLSCIYRIREKNGGEFGIMHIIDVLVGAYNEKIERWRHHELSTYKIGCELDRGAWRHLAGELVRLGLIAADAARYNVVSLTAAGRRALIERAPIVIREPAVAPVKARKSKAAASEDDYDTELFAALRALRRELADKNGVPAFVIFSDKVLRDMARDAPTTPAAMRAISGVGDKKLADFGADFLAAIRAVRG
jgi:ATP-dependent DNA helicase RecQ